MAQVYRHFDSAGALLYVGVSLSTIQRLGQHADHSAWFKSIARVEIQHFETRELALKAERDAIIAENPKYNIMRPRVVPFRRRLLEHTEETKKDLVRQIVRLRPLYNEREAAEALRTSTPVVQRMLDAGTLGHVNIPTNRGTLKRFVSGWQLLEFFEASEAKQQPSGLRLDLVR